MSTLPVRLEVNGIIITIEQAGPPEVHPVPARRPEVFDPEHVRRRVLAWILAEGARCYKSDLPKLAAIIKDLADRLVTAYPEPEKPPAALEAGRE